jgi:hypothetical protein
MLQLSYIIPNSCIQKEQASVIDVRVRRVINNFVKGQKLQKAYIHTLLRNIGKEIPEIEKEIHAYRVYHVVYLL